jgi:hypothetical protein
MYPHVAVVLGLAFEFEDRIFEREVTKYDEDTGKPYQKTLQERKMNVPEWLDKAIEDKWENSDDWHAIGGISVYRDQCTGYSCLVGKLLAFFDPREMGNEAIAIEVDELDKAAVLQWILAAGAPAETVTLDDIKIRIGTEWL